MHFCDSLSIKHVVVDLGYSSIFIVFFEFTFSDYFPMLADRSFAPSVYDSVIDFNYKAAVDLINDLKVS